MSERRNAEGLERALARAVKMYIDYMGCWETLRYLGERYDEDLENCHPESFEGTDAPTILAKAAELLELTGKTFYDLTDLAENELRETFCEICRAGEEVQRQVFGRAIPGDREPGKFFEEIMEVWDEGDGWDERMALKGFKDTVRVLCGENEELQEDAASMPGGHGM